MSSLFRTCNLFCVSRSKLFLTVAGSVDCTASDYVQAFDDENSILRVSF